ncbi:cyclic nucleotide-binding domain-containing protein [Fontisphaera persica]|uniref:cyclic nucleotide-binding domain-containing protein n=1 Tax=Fontisphaera persica TaxID=2974023 RepID=UPI0024C02892|nr:cyclic nucleotide-binding domain-containing protein [Fontisphaera persica]WCJ60269.1 cyclic nucleotide-binding domain-containing protein [Fontisphaera persica]
MTSNPSDARYFLWGADETVYGPVTLAQLSAWIQEERVLPGSWVYDRQREAWRLAASLPELAALFPADTTELAPGQSSLKAGALRRIKVFAELSDAQIQQFIQRMEMRQAKQWEVVVREGETGDAMYLILQGELRVRLMVQGRESLLATLQTGEFFGEISLFDTGPRSADVVANVDSWLLKISAAAFQELAAQQPELAAPFLLAVGKTMTARLRTSNKRYHDSLLFARASSSG